MANASDHVYSLVGTVAGSVTRVAIPAEGLGRNGTLLNGVQIQGVVRVRCQLRPEADK